MASEAAGTTLAYAGMSGDDPSGVDFEVVYAASVTDPVPEKYLART